MDIRERKQTKHWMTHAGSCIGANTRHVTIGQHDFTNEGLITSKSLLVHRILEFSQTFTDRQIWTWHPEGRPSSQRRNTRRATIVVNISDQGYKYTILETYYLTRLQNFVRQCIDTLANNCLVKRKDSTLDFVFQRVKSGTRENGLDSKNRTFIWNETSAFRVSVRLLYFSLNRSYKYIRKQVQVEGKKERE